MSSGINADIHNAFESAARAAGRDPDELVEEFKKRYVAAMSASADEGLELQDAAWDRLLEQLDELPRRTSDGVVPSIDHDEILYGGPAPGQKGGFPEKRS